VPQKVAIGRGGSVYGHHVTAGDDQEMDGGLGVEIVEDQSLIVLPNHAGGRSTCGDAAKDALTHG
jgi:hypothetical protein